MSKLLTGSGVPSDFIFASTDGTPLYLDVDTGSLYFLDDAGVVTSFLQAPLATKQDALVSGTNIKTVNGASVLGSGNLVTSLELAPSGDQTILALSSVYLSDFYEIASTKYLELGDGAVMEVG